VFLIGMITGYLLFAVILFRWGGQIWPVGLPVFLWLTAPAIIFWIRRRLTFVLKEVK
jgi:hypothetical protein